MTTPNQSAAFEEWLKTDEGKTIALHCERTNLRSAFNATFQAATKAERERVLGEVEKVIAKRLDFTPNNEWAEGYKEALENLQLDVTLKQLQTQ